MTSDRIRQQFLDFFKSKAHAIVPSSPVVPHDDPTLMFANAGMNQFKDVFLGTGRRDYTRAADTQKCIRAGGKHNDLDDVGQDTYHHTFFEMLGNWSFGDYFKEEAIRWAWELLTGVWGIEKERLHATYFEGDEAEGLEPDSEAAELWKRVTDIDPEHVHPGNKTDNFWEMGDTGPCGPCSEIHIDLTPDLSGAPLVNAGDPRVIEIWNLVFIQFNRDASGTLTPLPAKHVDTGMGFERLCAVLQGMDRGDLTGTTNYDTDVFTPLFDAIRKRTGAPSYARTLPTDQNRDHEGAGREATKRRSDEATKDAHDQIMVDVSYRVIADHIRCLTFALTDGAQPSNEGRGYVLRRILRRAVRYGRQYMNMHEPFLADLVPAVVEHMGGSFPELRDAHDCKNVEYVCEIIRDEEESFGRTFGRGLKLYREEADYARKHHHGRISGKAAFKLHDTYGFTIDLTELMAEEDKLTIDIGEYERLMEEARQKARTVAAGTARAKVQVHPVTVKQNAPRTDDSPKYTHLTCEGRVVGSLDDDGNVKTAPPLKKGESAPLLLDQTCFYGEQGGQVGDCGVIVTKNGRFLVEYTGRSGEYVLHYGTVESGEIACNDVATCEVAASRLPTMKNHTSTHIMNWALREVLGDHVQQKGSLVDPEKTRFDFSHNKPVSAVELTRIEQLCNEQIAADYQVFTKDVDQAKAREINTLRAVFGEKYPDRVRVVSIGAPIGKENGDDPDTLLGSPTDLRWMNYSVEFCGGTHVQTSKEARRFVLTAEEGVAKGIRRVVGISGDAAIQAEALGAALVTEARELLKQAKAPADQSRDSKGAVRSSTLPLAERVADLQNRMNEAIIPLRIKHELQAVIADLQKQAKAEEKAAASASADAVMDAVASLLFSAETVAGVTVVAGEVPPAKADALRGAVDWVRNKTEASAVLLATADDGKVTLLAGMSKDVVAKGVRAGDLVREVAPLVDGKGGGRPDMAQGGGGKPEGVPDAVARAKAWLGEKLS